MHAPFSDSSSSRNRTDNGPSDLPGRLPTSGTTSALLARQPPLTFPRSRRVGGAPRDAVQQLGDLVSMADA